MVVWLGRPLWHCEVAQLRRSLCLSEVAQLRRSLWHPEVEITAGPLEGQQYGGGGPGGKVIAPPESVEKREQKVAESERTREGPPCF